MDGFLSEEEGREFSRDIIRFVIDHREFDLQHNELWYSDRMPGAAPLGNVNGLVFRPRLFW
jgi:hypothetical protein